MLSVVDGSVLVFASPDESMRTLCFLSNSSNSTLWSVLADRGWSVDRLNVQAGSDCFHRPFPAVLHHLLHTHALRAAPYDMHLHRRVFYTRF